MRRCKTYSNHNKRYTEDIKELDENAHILCSTNTVVSDKKNEKKHGRKLSWKIYVETIKSQAEKNVEDQKLLPQQRLH